ncbi:MAG: WecB/TagA/CpsF family glycosyltransferase [Pseudohongiella sp.]|nr:WecB/TagA/CpsF family glycosyltransferase [Pseudohongiella sp.]
MKETLIDFDITNLAAKECCCEIVDKLTSPKKNWLACLNPHSYAVALKDQQFKIALDKADWLIPDGIGIVYASRFLGGQLRKRVTGADVFFGVLDLLNQLGGAKVFFIGSTESTLSKIKDGMLRDFPNVNVVGVYSPPFKADYNQVELSEMIDAINAAKPDVLWVGMTAPKQEKWIFENLPLLDIKFAAAIGAVFDFYAGNIQRANPLVQKLGLEWLIRFLREPVRLWRRYFISIPTFLWSVAKYRFRN